MINFPTNPNGQWSVSQGSDKTPDIIETRNLDFSKHGYIKVSPKVATIYNEASNADFKTLVGGKVTSNGSGLLMTTDQPFNFSLSSDMSISENTTSGVPSGSVNGTDTAQYGDKFVITLNTSAVFHKQVDTWTAIGSLSLTTGKRHPVSVLEGRGTLVIGDGNTVKQGIIDGSNDFQAEDSLGADASQLTLPTGQEAKAIAYNRDFVGIATWNNSTQEAMFCVWDGFSVGANYIYPIGSSHGYLVIPYKDTFLGVTGGGRILAWQSGGMTEVASFPSTFKSAIWGIGDNPNHIHPKGYWVDNDKVYINVETTHDSDGTEDWSDYYPPMPSGVWCYDPNVGLYHYASMTGALVNRSSFVATASVNIATNEITSGATTPATGTPVFYFNASTLIPELTSGGLYYTIKTGASTFKLATTLANAIAGTAIDLTGTGFAQQSFLFIPQSDFGQSYSNSRAGALMFTGAKSGANIYGNILFGGTTYANNITTDLDCLFVTISKIENRGSVVFAQARSENIDDVWQNVVVKFRDMFGEHDKIIVKIKTVDKDGLPVYPILPNTSPSQRLGTWVDSTSLTTTVDLSDVSVGDEIEFVRGAGSGYLAHITALSETSGTWTVTIDEEIRNIATSDTCLFYITNFKKIGVIDSDTITFKDGYAVLPVMAGSAKWIFTKLELRGVKTSVEDVQIINKTNKPSN